MNSSAVQKENKSSNKSPLRVSRGSQTPKKKNKTRNDKKESVKVLSQESAIEPFSAPPPTNTPKAASIIDSNYSASMYSTSIYKIKKSLDMYFILTL